MNWPLVKEVAGREIRTRSRTKAFRVITGILVAAALIGPIVAALWPNSGDDLREVTIGLIDVDDATQQQILAFSEDRLDVTLRDLSDLATDQVAQVLTDGDIDVALEPGPTLVWDTETDFEIAGVLFAVLQQQGVLIKGRTLGLGEDDIIELLAPIPLQERFADPTDSSDDLAMAVAFFGLMAAFMLPQVFGQLTMLSVVEEKSTRVVEVLLGHLRPRTLLMGKVLGLGALAVIQLMVVGGGAHRRAPVDECDRHPGVGVAIRSHHCAVHLGRAGHLQHLLCAVGIAHLPPGRRGAIILPLFIPLMVGFFVGQAAVTGDAETPLVISRQEDAAQVILSLPGFP